VIHDLARPYLAIFDFDGESIVETRHAPSTLTASSTPTSSSAKFELGVRQAVSDGVYCVVDGGSCEVGVESTVLDLHHPRGPMILRPGGVTIEQLREFLPTVRAFDIREATATASATTSSTMEDDGRCWVSSSKAERVPASELSATNTANDGDVDAAAMEERRQMLENPETPGMKYRHYSPTAEVVLIENPINGRQRHHHHQQHDHDDDDLSSVRELLNRTLGQVLARALADAEAHDHRVGLVRVHSELDYVERQPEALRTRRLVEIRLGDEHHPHEVAKGLFSVLRHLDEDLHVHRIIVEGISEAHEGLAVMNRIRKAASLIVECGSDTTTTSSSAT